MRNMKGLMKTDMNYKRFRHFGKDKVTMDFAFFAIAFNIKKMCSMITKVLKNRELPFFIPRNYSIRFLASENRIFCKKTDFDNFSVYQNLEA